MGVGESMVVLSESCPVACASVIFSKVILGRETTIRNMGHLLHNRNTDGTCQRRHLHETEFGRQFLCISHVAASKRWQEPPRDVKGSSPA